MKKRLLSLSVALIMCLSLFPVTAFAEKTPAEPDWEIFPADDPQEMPATQYLLLQRMIQNDRFYRDGWQKLGNAIKPNDYKTYHDTVVHCRLPEITEQNPVKYSNKGLRDTVYHAFDDEPLQKTRDKSGVMNHVPNDEGMGKDVLYVTYKEHNRTDDTWRGLESMSMVLFYDFKVEGMPACFQTPEVEVGVDTEDSLREKGITVSMGGSSDSYTVTAENPNDFENTVEKSYSYAKTTSASTSVSTEYSQNWEETTTVDVGFEIPVIPGLGGSVEQSFTYNYGLSNTYENTQSEEYEQSITDTITVPLPPHTKVDINVQVMDRETKIPYQGAAYITYKTLFVFVMGEGPTATHDRMVECDETRQNVYAFGRGSGTAVEDLDQRISNMGLTDFNKDMPDFSSWYEKTEFQQAASNLISGQPYARYLGDFYYKDKNTVIKPQQVIPLYPLDNLTFDTEEVALYEKQSRRLDSIRVNARNQYDVPYYGFNPNISGHWAVVDDQNNDASEFAVIEKDLNGNPVLHALKPADEQNLYLMFVPDITDLSPEFRSDLIALNILPTPLSQVQLEGQLESIILNDHPDNTADVSGLTVTTRDIDGNPFDNTGRIRWMAETADGFSIDRETGNMKFTQPGTYQIYAVVNGQESNRVMLEVLPPRTIDKLTVTGTIPVLYYNTDTENTFDLNSLNVSAEDQYGDPWALNPDLYHWTVEPVESVEANSEIQGSTLVGKVVGKDILYLEYPTGNGDEVIKCDNLLVSVGAKAFVTELYHHDDISDGVEGVDYDLSQRVHLYAEDQYQEPIRVPDDICWTLAPDSVMDGVSIHGNLLSVDPGTIPYAGVLTVYVRAGSPSCNVETEDIPVRFYQQPQLAQMIVSAKKSFDLKKDQNGYIGDYFTASGLDQYGREFAVNPEWKLKKGSAFAVDNTVGTITVLKNDSSDEIYAKQDGISSNALPVQVGQGRQITSMEVYGLPSRVSGNETLDLSALDIQIRDQNEAGLQSPAERMPHSMETFFPTATPAER